MFIGMYSARLQPRDVARPGLNDVLFEKGLVSTVRDMFVDTSHRPTIAVYAAQRVHRNHMKDYYIYTYLNAEPFLNMRHDLMLSGNSEYVQTICQRMKGAVRDSDSHQPIDLTVRRLFCNNSTTN